MDHHNPSETWDAMTPCHHDMRIRDLEIPWLPAEDPLHDNLVHPCDLAVIDGRASWLSAYLEHVHASENSHSPIVYNAFRISVQRPDVHLMDTWRTSPVMYTSSVRESMSRVSSDASREYPHVVGHGMMTHHYLDSLIGTGSEPVIRHAMTWLMLEVWNHPSTGSARVRQARRMSGDLFRDMHHHGIDMLSPTDGFSNGIGHAIALHGKRDLMSAWMRAGGRIDTMHHGLSLGHVAVDGRPETLHAWLAAGGPRDAVTSHPCIMGEGRSIGAYALHQESPEHLDIWIRAGGDILADRQRHIIPYAAWDEIYERVMGSHHDTHPCHVITRCGWDLLRGKQTHPGDGFADAMRDPQARDLAMRLMHHMDPISIANWVSSMDLSSMEPSIMSRVPLA
jgi:hypothetical protein